MWVLILTLIGSSTQTVLKLDGFKNEESCVRAGNLWIVETESAKIQAKSDVIIKAMCADKSEVIKM